MEFRLSVRAVFAFQVQYPNTRTKSSVNRINIANSIPIIAGNMKVSPAKTTKTNPKKRKDSVTSLLTSKNKLV